MAGDWIKIEHITPDKPKIHQIAMIIKIHPDEVIGKMVRFWAWADRHIEKCSGIADVTVMHLIDHVICCDGFAKALIDVGWLVIDENGVRLPNFERHNGQAAKNRALTRNRVKSSRAKCNADTVTDGMPPSLQESCQKREEASTMNQFAFDCLEDSPEAKRSEDAPQLPVEFAAKQPKTRKAEIEHTEKGMSFACWFRDLLDESNRPDDRMLPKWAKCYDDLLRIDGRTPEEVAAVCKWARADHFWSRNFLSPLKLRKKNDEAVSYFNVLKTQMEASKRQEVAPPKRETVMHWSQHL